MVLLKVVRRANINTRKSLIRKYFLNNQQLTGPRPTTMTSDSNGTYSLVIPRLPLTNRLDNVESVIDSLVAVYKTADSDTNLLQLLAVPVGFYEHESAQILPSLLAYTEQHPDHKSTSILDKYEGKKYTTPYSLYHDIKVVAASAIQNHKIGSKEYKDIDFFYKFSTELLLRDLIKLNLTLEQSSEEEDDGEILAQLSSEFEKISNVYSLSNGEVFVYINESEEPVNNQLANLTPYHHTPEQQETKITKQPLFTSLVGRSAVDIRKTLVADPYQLSKVIPSTKDITNNSQILKAVSQPSSRIPSAKAHPTQILDSFFHPNWYTIEAPKWLSYRQNYSRPPIESTILHIAQDEGESVPRNNETIKSFAPVYDLRQVVLSEELRNAVWFSHIGLKEISAIKNKYLNIDDDEENEIDKDESSDEDEDDEEEDEDDDLNLDSNGTDTKGEINVANLIEFNPQAIKDFEVLKKDKESIEKSPKELQRYISTHILKLNKLRQERYLSSNPNKLLTPSDEEIKLYKRIEKLLTVLLELNAPTSSGLSLQFSKKIPVLLNDYSGSLPGGLPPSRGGPSVNGPNKSARLQGLKHPSSRAYTRRRR